jgi:prephenate dehydrogenase
MKRIEKIAIIGAGFMGGSLAKALRKKIPTLHISAYARSESSQSRLNKTGIFSKVDRDLEKIVSNADIVFLAAPVEVIIDYFKRIKPFLKNSAIVTDLGSSKKEICDAAKKSLPKSVCFVGAHPLAGSEKSGIESSRFDLYKDSLCIITAKNNSLAVKTITRLWQSVGAKVVFMDALTHDSMLSSISHLPHVLSFSLTDFVKKEYIKFSPASLKDLTRISNSHSEVWADILISNRKNVIKDINAFIKILKFYENILRKKDMSKIIRAIMRVNTKQKLIQ